MATVLICIVVVFLICHIPRVVLNCTEFFLVDQMIECPDHFMPANWNLCLASVNHALLIINASINFIIYTSVGDSFKKSLRKLLERYYSNKTESLLPSLSAASLVPNPPKPCPNKVPIFKFKKPNWGLTIYDDLIFFNIIC